MASLTATKIILVVIRHPEKGDEVNGKAICDEIRIKVAPTSGPVCIYHDASGMVTANAAYAGEFKKLDKDLSDRVAEIVCAIPGSIPRMMAHTVAMFSNKKWSIFKDKEEALDRLNTMGFAVTGAELEKAQAVTIKLY